METKSTPRLHAEANVERLERSLRVDGFKSSVYRAYCIAVVRLDDIIWREARNA